MIILGGGVMGMRQSKCLSVVPDPIRFHSLSSSRIAHKFMRNYTCFVYLRCPMIFLWSLLFFCVAVWESHGAGQRELLTIMMPEVGAGGVKVCTVLAGWLRICSHLHAQGPKRNELRRLFTFGAVSIYSTMTTCATQFSYNLWTAILVRCS